MKRPCLWKWLLGATIFVGVLVAAFSEVATTNLGVRRHAQVVSVKRLCVDTDGTGCNTTFTGDSADSRIELNGSASAKKWLWVWNDGSSGYLIFDMDSDGTWDAGDLALVDTSGTPSYKLYGMVSDSISMFLPNNDFGLYNAFGGEIHIGAKNVVGGDFGGNIAMGFSGGGTGAGGQTQLYVDAFDYNYGGGYETGRTAISEDAYGGQLGKTDRPWNDVGAEYVWFDSDGTASGYRVALAGPATVGTTANRRQRLIDSDGYVQLSKAGASVSWCGNVSVDPASIGATATGTTTVAVTSLPANAACSCSPRSDFNDDFLFKFCYSTAGNLNVVLYNNTAAPLDVGAQTVDYCCVTK